MTTPPAPTQLTTLSAWLSASSLHPVDDELTAEFALVERELRLRRAVDGYAAAQAVSDEILLPSLSDFLR